MYPQVFSTHKHIIILWSPRGVDYLMGCLFLFSKLPQRFFYFTGVSHCSKHDSLWEIFEFMPNLPTKWTSEDKWLHQIWPSNRIPPWLSYHIYMMKILQPIHRYTQWHHLWVSIVNEVAANGYTKSFVTCNCWNLH
jgi:hypothetical protein